MAQASIAPAQEGFGATERRDAWWFGPVATVVGLSAFLIYGTVAAMQNGYFEIRKDKTNFHAENNPAVAPYLAPFYSPLIYDKQSHHRWMTTDLKQDLGLSWFPFFSPAFLILAFPGLFRFTCYYYRKAYYRAFVADPVACGVGEPWKKYNGENRGLGLLQNSHRYWMYFAWLFLILLTWDALQAFWWPTNSSGEFVPGGQFGIGLGTLIMLANCALLFSFTFGCNSVRHLLGGRMDCFSCPHNVSKLRAGYKWWQWSTWFNERHMEFAWLSLFSVGFTDLYIRLCAMGIWQDVRIL